MKKYILRKQPTNEEIKDLFEYFSDKVIATAFWQRNLKSVEDVESFSSLQNLLPVGEIYDVEKFAERIVFHEKNKSKVVIYGDYDADGAIAASILWRFLSKELLMDATVYIPDRHEKGYGLNKQALEEISAKGTQLVISVDCGVRDSELIDTIHSSTNMEILVTDHHKPGDTFPTGTVVHPLFPGHESANKFISGGVVVWKIVRYLEEKLGKTHRFSESVVDVAGTSLVTDMMPLLGENRVILKRALQKMQSNPSLGLKVLAEIAQVPLAQLSSYHLGYIIGPRLNASGRIGNQYTSTRLLSTDNAQNARKYAEETHELNKKRQEITKRMVDEAEVIKKVILEKIILVAGEGWDDGIIGLVAGKLMNAHNLPTIAIAIDKEKGIAKGSARSFGDFDITTFFSQFPEVFERYGGHQNAAGFTLKGIDIENLSKIIAEVLQEKYPSYIPIAKSQVDSFITSDRLNEEFFHKLSKLEPFGQGNYAPLFAIKVKVAQFSVFGQQGTHVRIELQTESGVVKGLAFDALRLLSKLSQGDEVIIIGKPKLDEYQGKKQVTFFVEDIVSHLVEEN